MKSLRNADIAGFHLDGFAKLNAIMSTDETDRVMETLYKLYRKFGSGTDLDNISRPWDTSNFDQKMIALRASRPRDFGALYDSAQSSVEAARLMLNDKLVSACCDALGCDPTCLSCSALLLRIDVPNDQRNTISWHQDSAYFPFNREGSHALVATIFLSAASTESGAVIICRDSHREGFRESIDIPSQELKSRQLKLTDDLVEKYTKVHATGKPGDGYLLQMNTIHGSGFNSSDRIRYSVILRFHRMDTSDFVPFQSQLKVNEYVSQKFSGQS